VGAASESSDLAVRRYCRVVLIMTRRVRLGVVRGRDRSRRSAAERAKFSKWDRGFMLRLSRAWVGSGVGSERQLVCR